MSVLWTTITGPAFFVVKSDSLLFFEGGIANQFTCSSIYVFFFSVVALVLVVVR